MKTHNDLYALQPPFGSAIHILPVLWLSVWAGVGGAVEIRGVGILVVLAAVRYQYEGKN